MRCPRNAGFTLVELMVALAVGGLVVAAGHQMLNATIDAATRSSQRRAPVLAAAGAREMLVGWLGSAFIEEDDGYFLGVHRVTVGTHADELAFTTSHGGALHPGARRIRLWIGRRPGNTRGLLAEIAPLAPAGGAPDTLDMAPEATGLALRYLVVENGRERWVSQWESSAQLPKAIDLRIEAAARVRLGGGAPPNQLSPILTYPIQVGVRVENW